MSTNYLLEAFAQAAFDAENHAAARNLTSIPADDPHFLRCAMLFEAATGDTLDSIKRAACTIDYPCDAYPLVEETRQAEARVRFFQGRDVAERRHFNVVDGRYVPKWEEPLAAEWLANASDRNIEDIPRRRSMLSKPEGRTRKSAASIQRRTETEEVVDKLQDDFNKADKLYRQLRIKAYMAQIDWGENSEQFDSANREARKAFDNCVALAERLDVRSRSATLTGSEQPSSRDSGGVGR